MIRNKINNGRLLIGIAGLGILLSASGCNTDGTADKDFFPAAETTPIKKITAAQVAVGAQHDATLYADHFDGAALNSLGQQKLDEITTNLPDEGPITIYLELSHATTMPSSSSRVDAVSQYLLASHLTSDQFKIVEGFNPGVSSPAGPAVANYGKTDTGSASNSTLSDSGSGQAGSANTAAH